MGYYEVNGLRCPPSGVAGFGSPEVIFNQAVPVKANLVLSQPFEMTPYEVAHPVESMILAALAPVAEKQAGAVVTYGGAVPTAGGGGVTPSMVSSGGGGGGGSSSASSQFTAACQNAGGTLGTDSASGQPLCTVGNVKVRLNKDGSTTTLTGASASTDNKKAGSMLPLAAAAAAALLLLK